MRAAPSTRGRLKSDFLSVTWGSRIVPVAAILPRVRIASDREGQGGMAINGLAPLLREAFRPVRREGYKWLERGLPAFFRCKGLVRRASFQAVHSLRASGKESPAGSRVPCVAVWSRVPCRGYCCRWGRLSNQGGARSACGASFP